MQELSNELTTAAPAGVPACESRPSSPGSSDRPLKIAVVGPIASSDIRHLLNEEQTTGMSLPHGYSGAPVLCTLIEGLLARGHEVHAITHSMDMPLVATRTVRVRGGNFTIEFCPCRPRAWRPNGWRLGRILDLYAFERRSMALAIRGSRPDVVHAHWAYEFALAAQSSGYPTIITSHDSPVAVARFYKGFVLGGYRKLRALMALYVLRQASCVTTVSPYMQDQLKAYCAVPINLVPNPISPKLFSVKRLETPNRQRVLMVCNGWGSRKNGQLGLMAFARLAEQLPDAELVVLGQNYGPGEVAEQWWRANSLVGNVRFLGQVPYPEVMRWMCCSEVLLHPALEESFGMVLAEAMATGIAVVAGKDSGAVPWVISGHGRLVDVRSAEDMCQAMLELLKNPAVRVAMARAAKTSVARRFSADSIAQQFIELYLRAIRENRAIPVFD